MTISFRKFIWNLVLVLLILGVSLVSLEDASARCERNRVEKIDAIKNAEWIVIAKRQGIRFENAQGKRDRYTDLEVMEYIKGTGPGVISVLSSGGASSEHDSKVAVDANYFGHRSTTFWTRERGRALRNLDCTWRPSFSEGDNRYLVFGPSGHYAGYENVTDNDRWVEYVREVVADSNKAVAPFPIDAKKYFQQVDAVVRLTATWSDGGPILETEVLKGPELPYFEMLYLSPITSMTSLLDPACSVRRVAPREKLSIDRLVIFDFLPENKIKIASPYGCLIRTGLKYSEGEGIFSNRGHVSFSISGDVVTFGKRKPVISVDGHVISMMSLEHIRNAIHSD